MVLLVWFLKRKEKSEFSKIKIEAHIYSNSDKKKIGTGILEIKKNEKDVEYVHVAVNMD